MRIILKEFSFMQSLDMMLIQNTVFVDFPDYLAAFLQSKLSVVDECNLTESTNKPLIDWWSNCFSYTGPKSHGQT